MIIQVDKETQEIVGYRTVGGEPEEADNEKEVQADQVPADFFKAWEPRKYVYNGAAILLNDDFKPPKPDPVPAYVTKEEFEKQRKELLAAQEAIAEIYESSLG